jgi:hypothetical protein
MLSASFFFPRSRNEWGKMLSFSPKKYNPLYNLQSMPFEREVDKVGAEEI